MSLDVNDYSFFSDSEWDDTFNTSFELPGTTNTAADTSFWDKVGSAINTPVGSGLLVGAAQGALGYISNQSSIKAAEKAANRTTEEQRRIRDEHNQSISVPFTAAKRAKYHGNP
jgi:hypothetical protein